MNLDQLIQDKSINAKAKITQIAEWFLKGELEFEELISSSKNIKSADKANGIEGIEFANKKDSSLSHESLLNFVTHTLKNDKTRVKWESA